jgi:hypothetical protein
MWISGFLLRAARLFSPQGKVEKSKLFNRLCGRKIFFDLSTDYFSTFHTTC